MDKENLHRLKQNLQLNIAESPSTPIMSSSPLSQDSLDPFDRIESYKARETRFLQDLQRSLRKKSASLSPVQPHAKEPSVNYSSTNEDSGLGNKGSDCESDDGRDDDLEREVHEFIDPLVGRADATVCAVLATTGALDQLDCLHRLVNQFMHFQEQNLRMTRAVKTTNTLLGLKMAHNKIGDIDEASLSDDEFDAEIEQNIRLMETILAAGNSASKKRGSSKRQRSKSVISDENPLPEVGASCNYQLRRQSAIVDFKPKISKWTKVKAAFKWEKANEMPNATPRGVKGKNVLAPINSEVARYLKVPTTICTGASSGDSVISTSSRDLGIAQSTDHLSSDSSGDEEADLHGCFASGTESLPAKRSSSLDGELSEIFQYNQQEKHKNRSAWSKVKGIVKPSRSSLKSSSRGHFFGASGSRDVSPCDSADIASLDDPLNRNDSFSSNQTSPGVHPPSTPTLTLTMPPMDPLTDEVVLRGARSVKKQGRHRPHIECVQEGIPLTTVSQTLGSPRTVPSPLNLKTESSDDLNEVVESPTPYCQRLHAVSMPNSPLKKSFEFFTELESAEASSNDKSEPHTPQRKLSDKTKHILRQREEIKRNYLELQRRLQSEFESKQVEWEKIRPMLKTTSSKESFGKEEASSKPPPQYPAQPMREADLPPDFKKKLTEWRTKKSQVSSAKHSPKGSIKESKPKIIDWEGWKTGKTKLPGQGAAALPNAKDLPEDFQKKLNEWKQIKASNKIPPPLSNPRENLKRQSLKEQAGRPKPYLAGNTVRKSKTADELEKHHLSLLRAFVHTEAPKKEVVVQTNKGVLKFEGISREFTRKLYEWEKSKGITPESSTLAFLKPGYKPVHIDDTTVPLKHEKSPKLQRSLSCDSISPNVSYTSISHQPSSLSLNDMYDREDSQTALHKPQISSQPDLFEKEPEAVIVEVEDEIGECALSLYYFEPYSGHDEDYIAILTTIEGVKSIKHLCTTHTPEMINHHLKQMRTSLSGLIDCLPKMSLFMAQRTVPIKLIRELTSEILTSLNDLESHMEERRDVDSKVALINDQLASLKDVIDKVALKRDYPASSPRFVPEINVTPEYGAHAVMVEASEGSTAKATVSVTPTFVCQEKSFVPERKSSDFESGASAPQSSSLESEKQDNRRLQRNLSTGSRRKVRLKRMGSRQNSKTEESDSDEETLSYVMEAPKKVKRKTSKCKKAEPEKLERAPDDQPQDVVFVLKIQPTIETHEVTYDFSQHKADDEVLGPISASVLIKTKRKIFSSVDDSTEREAKEALPRKPPLPQTHPSDPTSPDKKDISPNIKLMIQKYNQITDSKKLSSSPGSASPTAWRSPILDRRVKNEASKYQEQVSLAKSASLDAVKLKGLSVKKSKSTEAVQVSDTFDEAAFSYKALKKKLIRNLEAQGPIIDEISKLTSEVERSWKLQSAAKETNTPSSQVTKEPRPLLHQSISYSPDYFSTTLPSEQSISQRAEKLRRAKEEFFRQSSRHEKEESEGKRLSQISDLSCCTIEPDAATSKNDLEPSDVPQVLQKSESRLNFITSKFRKVKLRKDSKELPKQGALSALARQSLVADITGESSKADKGSNSSSRTSLNAENVKKSSSHIFSRFWRPGKEKLKKSRSLGLLNQNLDVVKRKESH